MTANGFLENTLNESIQARGPYLCKVSQFAVKCWIDSQDELPRVGFFRTLTKLSAKGEIVIDRVMKGLDGFWNGCSLKGNRITTSEP